MVSATTVSHSAQGHYARKLLSDLMEDYSNALRPVEDTDEALNVSLQITLSQIKDMVSPLKTFIDFLRNKQTRQNVFVFSYEAKLGGDCLGFHNMTKVEHPLEGIHQPLL